MMYSIKNNQKEKVKSISDTILKVLINYVKSFCSTASTYSDILPYCSDILAEQRIELIKTVQESSKLLNTPEGNYAKYLSSIILFYKLKVSLEQVSSPDTIILIEEILNLYKASMAKLNKKLEKGERHPADDLILVVDYLLQSMSPESERIGIVTPVTTIRILLLDNALNSSKDNFDFKIQLLKILMNHNFNYMTREVYDNLRIKGVLTETLGFIYEKYLIENIHWDKLSDIMKKYYKFLGKNIEGIGEIKAKSIKEGNFKQAEEFYNYEQHQNLSHHRIIISAAVTMFEYLQNMQAKGIAVFSGVVNKIDEQILKLKSPEKLIKNADVYTIQARVKFAPLISQYEDEIKKEFSMDMDKPWEDLVLDPILLSHMPIGKTNYKEGIMNVFGLLEIPQFNLVLYTLCKTCLAITNKSPNLAVELKSFEEALENFKVVASIFTQCCQR